MIPATSRTLLSRLRASARLAALVLLVFALKIGMVVACAEHDFADMGLGTSGDHALVVAVSDMDGADDAPEILSSHAGACSHGSTHHPAALTPTSALFAGIVQRGLNPTSSGLPPSASPSFELRPPIV